MSDASRTHTDEELLARFQNARRRPASSDHLGLRMLRVDQAAGIAEMEFQARPEFGNAAGQVQGGFLTAMLDECTTAAGMVHSGLAQVFPTLEMQTSFFRPAQVGPIRAVGRVIRRGKTISFLEGDLFDPEGRHLARATVTSMPQPLKRGG